MTTRQDLTVRQGTTWSHVHTVRDSAGSPVDLTGYTARMAVKTSLGAGNVAYLSTGSDADGGTITLGGAAGTVTLSMTNAETSDLSGYIGLPPRRRERRVLFLFDLELVDGSGAVSRELEGRLILDREVTG